MTGLDYGDKIKFIVSVGVFLCVSAFVGPGLYFSGQFDLPMSTDAPPNLKKFTHKTVEMREKWVLMYARTWNYLFGIQLVAGAGVAFFGFLRWPAKRVKIDPELARYATEEERERVKAKGHPSPQQANKLETRLTDSLDGQDEALVVGLSVSRRTVQTLKERCSSHNVLSDLIVGGRYFDVALQGKGIFTKSYLVEIKYLKTAPNLNWLTAAALQMRSNASDYARAFSSIPNTALMIVVDNSDSGERDYEDLKTRLTETLPRHRKSKHVVKILSYREFNEISGDELILGLGIPIEKEKL